MAAMSPVTSTLSPFTRAASLFLVGLGAAVLIGWVFDIHVLKALTGTITMKANAAIGLLTAGLALGWVHDDRRWARAAGMACAMLSGTLGVLTLSQHVAGWNLRIDELLFRETPGAAATASPGRMGPNSSTSLSLSAVALLCLYRGERRGIVLAQMLGAVVAVFALVPTVGYLYGAEQLYAIARYTGIAVHTGIALFVLALGIMTARPDQGPVAALMSDAPHGVMARRLLLSAFVVPLALGYVRFAGERQGLYDTGFGIAVFAVGVIVLLSLTIWRTAVALSRSEQARQSMEAARDELLVREREARERAERADRAKDEFIAALSHELRTPLNAVVGWMQMLQQGILAEATRTKATEAMARNARMLARLIEDLLDTSRITMGHLTIARARVNVDAVVREAIESVLPAAHAKGVAIALQPAAREAAIVGDAQRLQQVVWNVLSNAIKFSPPGSTVTVGVTAPEGVVAVSVRDEGEGIPPEFLPHVFDRFRQDDSAPPRERSGLGLGLYIARHLIEQHGGTIVADSEGTGRGATFTIRLPAARTAGVASAEAGDPGVRI